MATRFEQEPQVEQQRQQTNIDSKLKKSNGQSIFKSDLPPIPVEPARVQQNNFVNRHISNNGGDSFWQKLSLKTKATALAIALSTIPILAIGGSAYYWTDKNITQSVTQQQQARVISFASV